MQMWEETSFLWKWNLSWIEGWDISWYFVGLIYATKYIFFKILSFNKSSKLNLNYLTLNSFDKFSTIKAPLSKSSLNIYKKRISIWEPPLIPNIWHTFPEYPHRAISLAFLRQVYFHSQLVGAVSTLLSPSKDLNSMCSWFLSGLTIKIMFTKQPIWSD